ncbi:hypothetical protein PMAYCL1PPCAC_04944, partial [Pristionchus mayeri]
FYTIEMERAFSLALHIHSAVSSLLHCASFYLLLLKTPPNQREVRTFLVFIQSILWLHDISFDVLVHPMPLAPLPAAYFRGILARMGASVNIMMGLIVGFGYLIAVAFILCFVHKHQTIMGDSSKFKMSKVSNH